MNASFDKPGLSSGRPRACVVGAGVAGLTAAIELALQGADVHVFDGAAAVGGKMSITQVDGRPVDAGPTVLTMPWVFEQLFERAGARLGERVELTHAEVLARHEFACGTRVDLFADFERSVDAFSQAFGPAAGRGYRAFAAHAASLYATLREPFLLGQRPTFWSMLRAPELRRTTPWALDAHRSMIRSLRSFFDDPRPVQLFGRYATYVGSSPYETAGTLALIAHVEREGVRYVRGGMHRLAEALAALARELGVEIHLEEPVRELRTQGGKVVAVRTEHAEHGCELCVHAGDVAALASGALGESAARALDYSFAPRERSLSAITLSAVATVEGFPLVRHNVFFSADGEREFADLFRRRQVPSEPTVYVCAQDREDGAPREAGPERLFFIVNAPADGDRHTYDDSELERCAHSMTTRFAQAGLTFHWKARRFATPTDFARRFPGSAGAIYGRTSHGLRASLTRPGSRTRIGNLYLASGSIHPGAGVPMAALSGVAAARAIVTDWASIVRSPAAAIAGSTSTA